jgi:uncharacterized protein with FMN-binding domain
MSRLSPVLLAAALLCIAAGTALADVVYLKNGQKLEGAAEEKGGSVVVRLERGSLTFAKEQVDRVEKGTPPWEVYEEKAGGLKREDVSGHMDLARWCKDHGLPQRMKKELELVVVADPDNTEARKLLGHKKVDDQWLTPEEQAAPLAKKDPASPAGPKGPQDGVYRGQSRGYIDDVEVEVTLVLGKISEVKILSHQENGKRAQLAVKDLPLRIVDRQTVQVDGISSATATSNAIKRAAASALASARPVPLGEVPDGTYTGMSRGYRGEVVVQVVVKGGGIADVGVNSHREDRPETAIQDVPASIKAAQRTQVDAVTGATATSWAIVRAAQEALDKAAAARPTTQPAQPAQPKK